MGLLTRGTPLSWPEIKRVSEKFRGLAIEQFCKRFPTAKHVTGDERHWGDEIECSLVKFDHEKREVFYLLKAEDIFNKIEQSPELVKEAWHPEYTYGMIEGVPANPYDGLLDCAGGAEDNFRRRRLELQALLNNDEAIMTLGNFPLTGCPRFSFPWTEPKPDTSLSHSIFYPDEVIYLSHPHFPVVTEVLVARRGSKPYANIPIFIDANTPRPFVDDFDGREPTDYDLASRADDHIYLDSVVFGPSCCCLQETFQTRTLADARRLRNHFLPVCPVFLALSAATPIFRGYLADTDCRWTALKHALDDRTEEERGLKPLEQNRFRIETTRCDSVDLYIDAEWQRFNDVPIPYCSEASDAFQEAGVDAQMAQAYAHLFIRDPVQVYKEELDNFDADSTEMFEDFHLFHWRTVRMKLPPADNSSGWKIEFRPTEIQATDFQNAAFAVFTFLLSRLILERRIHTIMPISKVFENMTAALRRDAVLEGEFWWPRDITSTTTQEWHKVSAAEIVNGNADTGLRGLAELMDEWLEEQSSVDDAQKTKIRTYVDFVRQRADGRVKTVARWMRDFVRGHPEYKHDSVVTQHVAYDLLQTIHLAANGQKPNAELQAAFE